MMCECPTPVMIPDCPSEEEVVAQVNIAQPDDKFERRMLKGIVKQYRVTGIAESGRGYFDPETGEFHEAPFGAGFHESNYKIEYEGIYPEPGERYPQEFFFVFNSKQPIFE